jgi:hypothetical protein
MRHHDRRIWMMARLPMPEVASTMKPVLHNLLSIVDAVVNTFDYGYA